MSTVSTSEELLAVLEDASRHAERGQWTAVLELCRQGLDFQGDNVFALYLAGIASIQTGAPKDAITYLTASLQEPETDANKLSMLSSLLIEAGRNAEAIPYLEQWVKQSETVDNLNQLAVLYAEFNQPGDAIISFRRSLELQPEGNIAAAGLYPLLRVTCEWGSELETLSERIDELNAEYLRQGLTAPEPPFDNIHRISDPEQNFLVARSWSNRLLQAADAEEVFAFQRANISTGGKIRIGYLSADLHDHAIAHLMRGVFRMHNREEFEIHAYSHGPDNGSSYRADIAEACDKFIDIRHMSDREAAARIHGDRIDILIDLMGFTRNNRLGICALKPSPVQVTYLGFPGTTGSDFFDYIVTDEIVSPANTQSFYGENVVYLPGAYQANDNTQEIPDSKADIYSETISKFEFLFCSFNNPIKIDHQFFSIWMDLLKSIPNSGLWILQNNQRAIDNLRRTAEGAGVNPDRLVFADMQPRARHLERMACADLGLDTQTYNGHTTTSDAMWSGLPVVTMMGPHFASRVSASLLTAMDLPELITATPTEYADLAYRLATSPAELNAIRQKILKNRGSCSLFDTDRFTKNLEKGYREMWRRQAEGLEPATITISDLPDS